MSITRRAGIYLTVLVISLCSLLGFSVPAYGQSAVETWDLPYGLDEDPMAINMYMYPSDATQVTLADISTPDELVVVWYYGGPGVGWKWFKPGWPESTLATLVPGKYYIGIALTATEWEIPSIPTPTPTPTATPELTSLGEALDNTDLIWTTGGDAEWFGQTAISYYDNDAAQTGHIGDSQNTWLRTTVTGTGTLTFYWKVSSESSHDWLEFSWQDSAGPHSVKISGTGGWSQQSPYIQGAGSHVLEWKYYKDSSGSSGEDAGWVDKVQWLPAGPTPTPTPTSEGSSARLEIEVGSTIYKTATNPITVDTAQLFWVRLYGWDPSGGYLLRITFDSPDHGYSFPVDSYIQGGGSSLNTQWQDFTSGSCTICGYIYPDYNPITHSLGAPVQSSPSCYVVNFVEP